MQPILFSFESEMPWNVLGSIPEIFQTVSGSLNQALKVKPGETLLIRGGTSSIGMLACQLAKHYGLTVITTTRNADKASHLKENGVDYISIDNGKVSVGLKATFSDGVKKVLELIGVASLKDSLKCIKPKGIECMTGILSGEWTMKEFTPMGDILSLGRLRVYMGEPVNVSKTLLQDFINSVTNGTTKINIDKTFTFTLTWQQRRIGTWKVIKAKVN